MTMGRCGAQWRLFLGSLAGQLQVRERREELLENFAADTNRLEEIFLHEVSPGWAV